MKIGKKSQDFHDKSELSRAEGGRSDDREQDQGENGLFFIVCDKGTSRNSGAFQRLQSGDLRTGSNLG